MAHPRSSHDSPVPLLAVDDTPSNLLALKALTEHLDVELFTAGSCEEALRECAERSYAVILLDVMMPGADGFETLRQLRALPSHQRTPVIFLTAYDLERDVMHRAYALGAVDYLMKPIDPDVLRAKLSAFIALYRQESEIRTKTQALVIKDEHIAVLAHDLRNPLGVVAIGADALEKTEDLASVRAIAARIKRAALRMERLTADVLTLAQAAEHKLQPRKVSTDLSALCDELVADLRATHTETRFEQHTNELVVGELDPRSVQQAIANLLSNAIKFGTGWVNVRVASTEDSMIVEVQNGGEPIRPERMAILFDKFERAGEARPGTGLGLYIAQVIARAHGGDLSVRSDAVLTSFTLRLPRHTS